MVSISVVVLWSWMRIILIRIRIQDPKKNRYGSGSRPNFDTDPEPGINDTNPDPGKKGFSTKKIIKNLITNANFLSAGTGTEEINQVELFLEKKRNKWHVLFFNQIRYP